MGIIDYNSDLQVLVSVKGHPYERDAFFGMFESFEGIGHTGVEQPANQTLLSIDNSAPWDAMVFYDMPGMDFSTQPPGFVAPSEQFKANFLELLEAGKGMVFLHHAVASWPLWPEYGEIVGGRFFYAPFDCRGEPTLDSGYRHDVPHRITVQDPSHPVCAGVDTSFDVTDELYLGKVFEDNVIPLLRSDYGFVQENFYSAYHAVTGKMFCNEDWPHPPGSNLLGWVKHYKNSPIVYLQPGDGPSTYENPNYKRLVENAIRWVASEEAHAWAREQNQE